MRSTRRRWVAALVVALACCAPPTVAHAQGPPHDGPRGRGPSPADTTKFLPRWLHPWFELGGGWLVTPKSMRSTFESGQGLGAGLSARPRKRLELRAALDMQMLQAQHHALIYSLWSDGFGGAGVDTSDYQFTRTAWTAMLRPEVGVMPLPGVWLTAGAGGGWVNGTFEPGDLVGDFDLHAPAMNLKPAPAVMQNGWGWMWTAAARWEFEVTDLVPLGLELRSNTVVRDHEPIRSWAIRATYRVPDAPRRPRR